MTDPYDRGLAALDRGDPAAAADHLDAALASREADAARAEALRARGRAREAAGDRERAREDYDRALDVDPDDPDVRYNRGIARARLGDREGSTADLERATALSPRYEDAFLRRGNAYADAGDHESALADFDRAVEHTDGARAYFNRGNARRERGDVEGARADYERALDRAAGLPDEGRRVHRALSDLADDPGRATDHLYRAAALAVACGDLWDGAAAAREAVALGRDAGGRRLDAAALAFAAGRVGSAAGGFRQQGASTDGPGPEDLRAVLDGTALPDATAVLYRAATGRADPARVASIRERATAVSPAEAVENGDLPRLRLAATGALLDQLRTYGEADRR